MIDSFRARLARPALRLARPALRLARPALHHPIARNRCLSVGSIMPSLFAWAALVGCEPSFDWTIASRCGPSVDHAVAVETGDCGNSSGTPIVWAGATPGAPVALDTALSPGTYCFTALALQTSDGIDPETRGYACRIEALDRVTRRVPTEHGPLESRLDCGLVVEPTPALDTLLENVAGCCADCDVQRCTCSAGCDIEATGDACAMACPDPVRGAELVMGRDLACVVHVDGQFVSCWGQDGPGAIGEALRASPGVAHTFEVSTLLELRPEESRRAVTLDVDDQSDRLCVNTGQSSACVGQFSFSFPEDRMSPELIAATEVLLCFGGSELFCIAPAREMVRTVPTTARRRLSNASALAAVRGLVCGLVGGEVYCAEPSEDTSCATGCTLFSSCECHHTDLELSCQRGLDPRVDSCGATAVDFEGSMLSSAIRLESGWGRICAINQIRNVFCWTPTTRPTLVTLADGSPFKAFELALGEEHVCRQDASGEVSCGVLDPVAWRVDSLEVLPTPNVTRVVAGPDGVTCSLRGDDGTVACHQHSRFADGDEHPLLGVDHTSTLVMERPVCP